jgi:hypothetical protein
VTNMLPDSQGGVHYGGAMQVVRMARSPVRKAARKASRTMRSGRDVDGAPDRGCQEFPFLHLLRSCP